MFVCVCENYLCVYVRVCMKSVCACAHLKYVCVCVCVNSYKGPAIDRHEANVAKA